MPAFLSSSKNYEHRSIPIPDLLRSHLAAQIAGRPPDQPVIYGAPTKTRLRNHTFRNGWFDPAAVEVGLPGLTPHELRHTGASLAVSAGANVKAVPRMLGHASAAVTLDVYSDLFDDDLGAVATALNKAALRSSVGKMWAAPGSVAGYTARRGEKSLDDRGFLSVTPAGFEPALPPWGARPVRQRHPHPSAREGLTHGHE
jgi:hypothetical protein